MAWRRTSCVARITLWPVVVQCRTAIVVVRRSALVYVPNSCLSTTTKTRATTIVRRAKIGFSIVIIILPFTIYHYYYNSFIFVRAPLLRFAVYALVCSVWAQLSARVDHNNFVVLGFGFIFRFFGVIVSYYARPMRRTPLLIVHFEDVAAAVGYRFWGSAVAPWGQRTLWTAVPWWTHSTTSSGGPGARRRRYTSRRPTPMTCTFVSESSSCLYSSRTTWALIGWSRGFLLTSTPAYLFMSECNAIKLMVDVYQVYNLKPVSLDSCFTARCTLIIYHSDVAHTPFWPVAHT